MLEMLPLNHGQTILSQGKILIFEAFASKGYFGYCNRKLPTWNKMC